MTHDLDVVRAYVDGELDDISAARMANAAKADLSLAASIAAERQLRDLIVASETATFGQVFVRIGLMPDGGSTYLLPRLVGYHKAFELMALGDLVPGGRH